jgi:hypothetical protein
MGEFHFVVFQVRTIYFFSFKDAHTTSKPIYKVMKIMGLMAVEVIHKTYQNLT